jgi:hypothetical protein
LAPGLAAAGAGDSTGADRGSGFFGAAVAAAGFAGSLRAGSGAGRSADGGFAAGLSPVGDLSPSPPFTTIRLLHFIQRIFRIFPATLSSGIEYFVPQLSQWNFT